jgi:hypothetical protein
MNLFYHHRVADHCGYFRQSQSPPAISIRPLRFSLHLLESRGIGEVGEVGDAFRANIILRHAVQELGLAVELEDVFDSPRETFSPTFSLLPRKHDAPSGLPTHDSALLRLSGLPSFNGAMKICSVLSTVLEAFVAMPMTIATLALTVICFYSRPIALRVGV